MGVLRRKSPLFHRKKSVRNVSVIEAEVDYIVQRSPFLLEAETRRAQYDESPPTFLRKEYQTGGLLGTGSFSQVHSIIGFKLSSSHSKKQRRSSKNQAQFLSSYSSDCSVSQLITELADGRQAPRINLTRSAFDEVGNARYAVKFVKKELTKNPKAFCNAAADLIVEAKYLMALDHPNILKVRGTALRGSAGFLDGYDGFFFIVDRLEETLGDRIRGWKDRPLDSGGDLLTVQANIALQIASALEYLHQRRILFRDLKPDNVGFGKDSPNTVQLFDFGLCRELPATGDRYQDDDDDDEAFEMSGAGTSVYMAPEVMNSKCYNLKADVYSWAFVFHEMIALKRPFQEFSVEEHKEFVCEIGQRPSFADLDTVVPSSLQALLRRAWDQDPTERLTMRQVCQQLRPIIVEELETKIE